ncbi:hypothetical protein GGR57DRAFT_503042 [Xylariaceae sp. FL1272]|nr:hypothetical protein GGR57DRAFT_503042 [Xylariaceae sp. FL1272]
MQGADILYNHYYISHALRNSLADIAAGVSKNSCATCGTVLTSFPKLMEHIFLSHAPTISPEPPVDTKQAVVDVPPKAPHPTTQPDVAESHVTTSAHIAPAKLDEPSVTPSELLGRVEKYLRDLLRPDLMIFVEIEALREALNQEGWSPDGTKTSDRLDLIEANISRVFGKNLEILDWLSELRESLNAKGWDGNEGDEGEEVDDNDLESRDTDDLEAGNETDYARNDEDDYGGNHLFDYEGNTYE